MLVQFENNWIQKIPRTAKLNSAYGLVQFGSPQNFSHPIIFKLDRRRQNLDRDPIHDPIRSDPGSVNAEIGQHVVLLHILIMQVISKSDECESWSQFETTSTITP